ncbi:MAG: hypothetical protein EOM54_10455 [Clostridia bacterium]|nr:hypothetical protein [Clostridia bacterium]
MIEIDGTTYNVNVRTIKRKAPFLDKYAKRVDSGDLQRKLIGVYYNFELTFAYAGDADEYDALYDKLTEPVEYHTVKVPTSSGWLEYTAYFGEVDDEIVSYDAATGVAKFKDLKVEFIAKEPARVPA